MSKKIDRTGEEKYNNQGCLMKIIKYNSNKDLDVQFEDGWVSKNKNYENFKKGAIKNPNYPIICNVGFIGVGKYKTENEFGMTNEYKAWYDMLKRCYDEKRLIKQPTYKNCTVCKDWLNFQNFAKWYNENYYKIEDEVMCLDKDILCHNLKLKHKIYSPRTCLIVPQRINVLFVGIKNNIKDKYDCGKNFDKRRKKFRARCNINKTNKNEASLGYYDNPEEAFQAYKTFKESYIKQIADLYKSKYPQFPQRLYEAMYSYQVEITD